MLIQSVLITISPKFVWGFIDAVRLKRRSIGLLHLSIEVSGDSI